MSAADAGAARATATIPALSDPFVVMCLVDVGGDAHAQAAGLATEAHRAARESGGLRFGALLADDEQRRVVTYSEWASQADFLATLLDEERSAEWRSLQAIAERVWPMTFSLLGVRASGDADGAEVFASEERHCCIVVGVCHDAAKRDFIVRYNLWETERYVGTLDGFCFATFLVGHDPHTFAEFTCWESSEQFRRAFADPGFQEHIPVNNHWCETDVSFHRVVDVTAA